MRPWTSVLPRLTHGPARSCPPSVSSPKYRRGFLCLRHGSARFGSLSVYPLVSTPATTRCRPGIFRMCLTPHSSTKERQGWRRGAVRRAKYEKYEKKAKNAKKCCAMMSKTRPSSSSMGATPPQRRAERVEHSQQHVRRGAEQPRGGGARNAWGRKGERDGGRRSRGERRKISSKREKGKNCQNPGFQYHSSLNLIVQYCTVPPPSRLHVQYCTVQ